MCSTNCSCNVTGLKGKKGDPGRSLAGVSVPTTATYALSVADSGTMINLSRPTGLSITLPTAPTDGTYYEFTVVKDVTSNTYDILSGTITLEGSLFAMKAADYPAFSKPVSTDNKITMNGSTTGGLVGTNFRLVYSATDRKWIVSGNTYGSGVLATSFATV